MAEKNGTIVMGMDAEFASRILSIPYSTDEDTYMAGKHSDLSSLILELEYLLEPRPLCEAESDPSFRQIVPYVIVGHANLGMYYVTRRIDSATGSIGKINLGVERYIEEGESIETALLRGLDEKIDLPPECIIARCFCGFLNTKGEENGRTQIGAIYRVFIINENIRTLEPDTHEGFWATLGEIRAIREKGFLDRWGNLVFDHLLEGTWYDRPRLRPPSRSPLRQQNGLEA